MVTNLMIAGYFIFPVLIILVFTKYGWAKRIGTVLFAYVIGVVIALTGVLPAGAEPDAARLAGIQKLLMNLSVPIAIPLMLFNSDFKLWTKSLPKTMAVLGGGLLSIVIAVFGGYFVFRNTNIPDFGRVAAMMTGLYTGGTMNFAALGEALHVAPTIISITLTFETIVTLPFIVFILAGGYKLLRKAMPYQDSTAAQPAGGDTQYTSDSFEDYRGMFRKGTFGKMMLGLLLSVGILAVGAGLSLLITGTLNELVIILIITTLAIAASFIKKVRELPKTFELGMFFILIFSVCVASQFNVRDINRDTVNIMYFIAFIMVVSILLHILFCRLFKVNGDLFTVGHIALLCSPPFVPPIVEALGNKKVLISGIVIGLAGYAVGTYLGTLIAVVLGVPIGV